MTINSDELVNIFDSSSIRGIEAYGGIDGLLNSLETDREKGINSDSVQSRIQRYGDNDIPEREIKTFLSLVREAISDNTIIILIVCAFASLILEFLFAPASERSTSWIDGTAILMAVVIVSVVQAYSNYQQELQFSAVNRIKDIFDVCVIRDGAHKKIKSSEIVVGDMIQLEPGDKIPSDCLLIIGNELQVDQSAVNGESEPSVKDENDPFLTSDTIVADGRGTCMAICVGMNSHKGKVFNLLNEESKSTPLQEKLEVLALKIGGIGIFAASLTFVVLLVGWIIKLIKVGFSFSALREPLRYFIVALTIVACAVPEGLPLAVTISLAYSMRKMMDDNNFVRNLASCETMGSVTVICTDKTGTLTLNQMNVNELIYGNQIFNHEEITKHNDVSNIMKSSISINSNANINDNQELGSKTECALLRYVNSLPGTNYKEIREKANIVKCFQFDRVRKLMSTIEKQDDKYIVHVKGAPEELLNLCTKYYSVNDQIMEINNEFKESLKANIDTQCSKSYRLLGIAYKISSNLPETCQEAESDLTLIAILCIRDSLRPRIVESISNCHQAGIQVIMVTGDHMLTAEAIARECKIMKEDSISLTGKQLRELSHEDFIRMLPKLAVIARSTPMDKNYLVKKLQEANEVVSVTGDGTNDVAALMAADVGLSMGKCGTEFAKEASDIIILDDDFKSIVSSITWGRCIFNNIQRFLQFQLTTNVSTLFISFVSACFLSDTPFQAVQLLWVNLIMDSLGALALATGKPHPNLLDQKPNSRDLKLITPYMIKNILVQSTYQIVVVILILIFNGNLKRYSEHHYTFLFNVFVLCQAFNLFNARSVQKTDIIQIGIFDTPLFLSIFIGIVVFQFIFVQIIGKFTSCVPLSLYEWFKSFIISLIVLPIGYISRNTNVPNISLDFLLSKQQKDDDFVPLLSKDIE